VTWSEFADLIALILICWLTLAAVAGIGIGKFCKAGRGPEEESSDEG